MEIRQIDRCTGRQGEAKQDMAGQNRAGQGKVQSKAQGKTGQGTKQGTRQNRARQGGRAEMVQITADYFLCNN